MPILPNNDLDYIDDESEDITSEDMTDGSSVTENNATYNDPFDYTGPSDIGVPDSLPVDPVVPESDEDCYYVTYYNRGDLTDYEPAYLQELAEAGCKFYAIYDDETEVEIQWTDIEDLDPLETEIDLSEAIASASNQHFWDDTNGVHVSEVAKEDWQAALEANFADLSSSKNYYNILMNSLGLLLRRANFNLTSINRAAISFYDGLGNDTVNIMASFGRNSAQIGRSTDKHVVIDNSGLTAYNSDGTLAPLTGTFDGANINNSSITNSKIVNGTIEGTKIASATIDNSNIKNGTITGTKIAESTIENSNIKDGTITGTKIQGSTLTDIPYAGITDADIEVARVANAEIAKAEVNYAHITNGVIDNAKIDKANVNGLAATYATITNLNAATARIGTIESDYLKAADMTAEQARVNNLLAGKADITDLSAATARIDDLEADHVSVEDFEAEQANIDNLQAATADIATIRANSAKVANLTAAELEADHATVGNLSATYATIDSLDAAEGRIGTLETDNTNIKGRLTAAEGNITTLNTSKANVTDLTAATGRITDLESTRVRTSDLEANYITADTIEATYTKTDFSNTDVAWIQNGVIKDGSISSAMINSVSANKLTAGTINGSVINVTNLNADNITAGTINGQRIGEGSLSLDKLSEDVYTEAEVDAKLSTMQSQIDGAIETWTGTTVPTLQNSPASSWNTTALKDSHVGDVYFVVNSNSQQNGYNYRFTKSGSTYSWQLIKDSDVTNALQRLSTAEGKITTFDSDISQLKTDTGTLTTKTTSLETRMSDAEADILDKVDTTTFNEVSDTVDSHSQSISQMSTTLSNKADSSTVSAVTQRVSKNEQDISGINTTIGALQTTVESKADGSTVETMSTKLNTVSDTVDGHTQSISSITSTQTTMQGKLDKTLVETTQLWFSKANTTAPNKPTAQVTSTSTEGNAWRVVVPAYSSSYPNYYYCYQWKYSDGTYGWSSVTRDIAMGESQERARTAITNAANAQADIDGLEIGGRNLARGTAFANSTDLSYWYKNQNAILSVEDGSLKIIGNQTTSTPGAYTLISVDEGFSTLSFWYRAITSGGAKLNATGLWNDTTLVINHNCNIHIADTEWHYYTHTFELTSVQAESINRLYIFLNQADHAATDGLYINRLKLEKGNRATDWSPAPEDVDSGISAAQTSADNAQATANKNVKSTTQLWYTKANETAPAKPTARVTSTAVSGNGWRVVVPTYASDYPYYFYCYQYELADGTFTWSDVVYDRATTENQSNSRNAVTGVSTLTTKTNDIQDTVDGHTQSISSITSTQTSIQQNAVKSTVQLWFTKANTTAPNKPTAHVTTNNAATGNAWNLAVPTYNASYPNYYYCYEYEFLNGSYGWSAVTRDIATGEMQATARKAQNDIDNLEIGGRNLLKGTGSYALWDPMYSAWSSNFISTDEWIKFTPDENKSWLTVEPHDAFIPIEDWDTTSKYTLSIDIKYDNRKTNTTYPRVSVNTATNKNVGHGSRVKEYAIASNPSTNDWTHFEKTFDGDYSKWQSPGSGTAAYVKVLVWLHIDSSEADAVYIRRLKLEKGNRATDWTPAPEDVDADISTAQTSADNAQATANKNVKESQQLWFTKANGSAPNKPSAKVTSTSTGGNAWTTKVPTYNASYPHYFYCMQYIAADGTVTWSDVVYDQATTEAQSVARTTSANLSTLQQDYATFKQTTQNFESTIGTTYATKTELQTTDDKIENLEIGGRNLIYHSNEFRAGGVGNTNTMTQTVDENGYYKIVFSSPGGSWNSSWWAVQNVAFGPTHQAEMALNEGDSFTVSFIIRAEGCTRLPQIYLKNGMGYYSMSGSVSEDWSTIWYTGTWKDDNVIAPHLSWVNINADSTYWIKAWKLEKGNKPTDWTPAPEDIDAAIDKVDSKTSVRLHLRRDGWTDAQWGAYASVGHADNFANGHYASGGATSATGFDATTLNVGDLIVIEGISRGTNIPYSATAKVTAVPTSATGAIPATVISANNAKAIEARVSTAETSITQTNNQIALKANASDVYTKTQVDGKITQEVSNRNSAIEQSASAINLSVSQTYTTKTEFNALEIGGRNYLKGSELMTWDDYGWFSNTGASVSEGVATLNGASSDWKSQIASSLVDVKLFDDDYVRVSFDYKASVDTYTFIDIDGSSSSPENKNWVMRTKYKTSSQTLSAATEWTRYEWSVIPRVTSDLTSGSGDVLSIYVSIWNRTDNSVLQIRHLKLEKGTKATDWTPAPEDTVSQTEFESAKSEIKATTDGITSTVSKISSAKYLVGTGSNTLSNIKAWATEGYTSTWGAASGSTANLRVGDLVYLQYGDTTRSCKVYIKGTVNSWTNTAVNITSHGYEDILPVDTIKSTINQSSDSVKIQAKHVEIDGAAIFSNTAFKQAADAAYDAKGSAATAKSEAISAAATDATSKANAAEANANSYSDKLDSITTLSANYKKFKNPAFFNASGNQTGALIITTPITAPYMVLLHLNGYNYSGGSETIDIEIGFYNYSKNFHNYGYVNYGTRTLAPVRLAKFSSTDKRAVIIVGDIDTTWSYPKLVVSEVSVMHENPPDSFANGWNMQLAATLPTTYVELTTIDHGSDFKKQITNVTATANNAAPKSSAIARTQRIYWRATSNTKPSANTTWLSTSGDGYGNWSLNVPQLTKGTTKYPYLYTAVQSQTVSQQAAGSTCTCSAVTIDDSTTVIDGGQIITGSVDANRLAANSVTADKVAAGAITAQKLNIGDTANYSALDVGTAAYYGFMYDDTADGRWFTMTNLKRDTAVSPVYDCQGGEKFKVSFEVSSSVQGRVNSSATADTYLTVAVGAVCCYDTGGGYNWPLTRYTTSSASAPVTAVESIFTLHADARRFWIFIQLNGVNSPAMTGTFKIRNLKVYKMTGGELIVDGTVKASAISASSGTFNTANIPDLNASKITAGDISAARIKANVISAINSLTAGTIDADRIDASSLRIGYSQVNNPPTIPSKVSDLTNDSGYATTEQAQGYADAKDSAIAAAAKRTDVSIAVTAINYDLGTATLQATLYIDGTATTSGVTYKWLKDGAVISGQTARTLSVTAAMGLSHVYSCTVTYS